MGLQVRTGSVSIKGNFRDNNEDSCVVDPEGRYFIVADGMGGQCAGERASELATELFPQRLEQLIDFEGNDSSNVVNHIDKSVAYANGEIMALSQVDPNLHNMGTTVAFIVAHAKRFFVGGVGDSRVYRLNNDKLEQLTRDHSLTQALVDAGTISEEDASTHRYRNVLYRYLGTKDGAAGTEAVEIAPEPGDRFVICSDGVTDGIEDDTLAEIVGQHDDPQQAAEAVVESAEKGGSRDNITCIVVHID